MISRPIRDLIVAPPASNRRKPDLLDFLLNLEREVLLGPAKIVTRPTTQNDHVVVADPRGPVPNVAGGSATVQPRVAKFKSKRFPLPLATERSDNEKMLETKICAAERT